MEDSFSSFSVTVRSLTEAVGRRANAPKICGGEVLCPNREDPTFHFKEDHDAAKIFARTCSTSSCLSWTAEEPEQFLSFDLNIN